MSLTTIRQASNDAHLRDRVIAGLATEAWQPHRVNDEFGARVRLSPETYLGPFVWSVAVDYRDAYEYAVNTSRDDPGGDPGVITDDNINAAVQAYWDTVAGAYG